MVVLEPKKIKSVTSRTSNQSILKEINPDAKGLMLKLKFQYFGHLVQRVDSLEKTLMLGKIEGRRRRGWQRMRWLDGIADSMGMGLSRLHEIVKDRGAWCAAVHIVTVSRAGLSEHQQSVRVNQQGVGEGRLRCSFVDSDIIL